LKYIERQEEEEEEIHGLKKEKVNEFIPPFKKTDTWR